MSYVAPFAAAIVVAFVTHGLIWSPQRRRMATLGDLVDTLSRMPRDHPAYERLSTDVDNASVSLSEHLGRADARAYWTFCWTCMLGGLALIYASAGIDHFALGKEAGFSLEDFGSYTTVATALGLLSIALGFTGFLAGQIKRFRGR